MALFQRMKEKYGNTNAWRELMACDAYQLMSVNLAYGYKDGVTYKFEAEKVEAGYNVNITTATLPTQEENILRAQASNQMRIRLFAEQSSQKMEENLRLREKITALEGKIREQDAVIKHHQTEIKLLRAGIVDSHTAVSTAVRASTRTWTFALMLLAFLVLGFLTGEAQAIETDCTRPIEGCYFDIFKQSTRMLTYTEVQNMCYGKTNTIMSAHAVNLTQLLLECEGQMSKLSPVGVTEWVEPWCKETLVPRLVFAECRKKTWEQYVWEKMELIQEVANPSQFGVHQLIRVASYMLVVLTIIHGANFLYLVPLALMMFVLQIPTLCFSVAINFFPTSSIVYIPILYLVDNSALNWVFFCHWVTSVMYGLFIEKTFAGVSHGVFMACALPVWYYVAQLVRYTEIPVPVQIVMLTAGVTTTFGARYLNATVTIQKPDGTVEKQKRMDIFKDNFKDKLLKAQNAIRGIIPEIPDKTRCILRVETNDAMGVGFRFMNEIVTIGHVMGDNDTATLKWNGIGVTATLKKRIPLFESCDELVIFKLPTEFQGMKPLRLSRLDTSDYMQLLTFKDQDIATYTGWVMLDGNWMSNTFQTKAGDSGAPYVDRNGRLVGIHLGTQGVVAQGYNLTQVLKTTYNIPLAPINETPEPVTSLYISPPETKQDFLQDSGITAEDIMRELSAFKQQLVNQCTVEQVGDGILERVIEGTKKSHAAIACELEKVTENLQKLTQMLQSQQEVITKQEMRIQALERVNTTLLEQKKKRNKERTERFMKVKVLTEEEYQRMLDEGWTSDEITNAVSQLRQRAWQDYEMEEEDYEPEEVLDDFLMTYQRGKTDNAVMCACEDQIIFLLQSRKTFKCPKCKGRFTRGERHNPKTCRGKHEEQEQPKNVKTGRRGTSQ